MKKSPGWNHTRWQKEVWRILGNPGALLLDGEIAGVWRAKVSGRKRVDLTVTAFVSVA